MAGHAGAGRGCFALASDEMRAHQGVPVTPNCKNTDHVDGSPNRPCLLPRPCRTASAQGRIRRCLTSRVVAAARIGAVGRRIDHDPGQFEHRAVAGAPALALSHNPMGRLRRRRVARAADGGRRPLADRRKDEFARMQPDFYGLDPGDHEARCCPVPRLAHAWTPRHAASHRKVCAGLRP